METEPDSLLAADNQPASTGWKNGIERTLRYNKDGGDRLAKFDDNDSTGLATSYLELESSLGTRVKMPDDKTTPEETSAFYRKLGAPETADGYTKPELAEGKTYDEEFLSQMSTAAVSEGITNKQFGKLIEKYLGIETAKAEEKIANQNREHDATVQQLQQEWAGQYDKNLKMSQRAWRELVPADLKEEFTAMLMEKGLDNNLIFTKISQILGSKMLDDTFINGAPPKGKPDYVPANINSPEMYSNGDSEECKNARVYFRARGHVYGRED